MISSPEQGPLKTMKIIVLLISAIGLAACATAPISTNQAVEVPQARLLGASQLAPAQGEPRSTIIVKRMGDLQEARVPPECFWIRFPLPRFERERKSPSLLRRAHTSSLLHRLGCAAEAWSRSKLLPFPMPL